MKNQCIFNPITIIVISNTWRQVIPKMHTSYSSTNNLEFSKVMKETFSVSNNSQKLFKWYERKIRDNNTLLAGYLSSDRHGLLSCILFETKKKPASKLVPLLSLAEWFKPKQKENIKISINWRIGKMILFSKSSSNQMTDLLVCCTIIISPIDFMIFSVSLQNV